MNIELTKTELEKAGISPDNATDTMMALVELFAKTFGEPPGTIYLPRDLYRALELKTKKIDLLHPAVLTLRTPAGNTKIQEMPGETSLVP